MGKPKSKMLRGAIADATSRAALASGARKAQAKIGAAESVATKDGSLGVIVRSLSAITRIFRECGEDESGDRDLITELQSHIEASEKALDIHPFATTRSALLAAEEALAAGESNFKCKDGTVEENAFSDALAQVRSALGKGGAR